MKALRKIFSPLAMLLFIVGMIVGCSAPQRVVDDIALLKLEAQAHYSFNQQVLEKSISTNDEELQKKLKLLMISKIAHQRTMRGLQLLSEYLDSIEFMSNAEASATKQLIIDTVEEVLRRRSE